MSSEKPQEKEFSFKDYFVPLTTTKVIHFIILVGLLVYANGLINPFLGDDFLQITNNRLVHSLSNIFSFFFGSTFYNGQGRELQGVYFKPFLSTSYALIYSVFGDTPFWYHLFQLILHLTNTSFLYLVLRYFLKDSTSFFLALVFLVHPINSQAVLYVAAFQEPLFFLFGIIAFWLIIKYKCEKYLRLIVVLLLFSLFSKETGILFFALAGYYIALYQKKYIKLFLIYASIPLTIYFVLRIHAVGFVKNPHITPLNDATLIERIMHIPSILLFYFKTFIFPSKLSWTNNWSHSVFTFDNFYLPLVIILILIGLSISIGLVLKKKFNQKFFKNYIFFVGVFLIGLLLHVQVIPLDMITCESWFYFPIVGLLGIIGTTYEALLSKISPKVWLIFALMIFVGLSFRTFNRSFDWRNEVTMNYKDLEFNEDNFAAKTNIALHLYQEGKLDDAKKLVEESIARYPRAMSYNLLGLIYFEKGEYSKAKEAYSIGLKKGGFQLQYQSMAQLGVFYGNPDDNIRFIEYGLQKYPNDAYLWQFLAINYYNQNRHEEAVRAIENAYKLDPSPQMSLMLNSIVNKKKLILKPYNLN